LVAVANGLASVPAPASDPFGAATRSQVVAATALLGLSAPHGRLIGGVVALAPE
jgi:hypothetical protein